MCAKLTETAPVWRKLISPWTEYVTRELWAGTKSGRVARNSVPPTRLTQQRRTEAKGRIWITTVESPKADHLCPGCGKTITNGRIHCAKRAVSAARNALSMLPGLDRSRDILPKRSQRKRRLSVSMRKRDPPGHQRGSPHGSQFKCICRKFNLCSLECRAQLLRHGLEFPAGTRVGFAKAIDRTQGTGLGWQGWWVFRKESN
jgi:hypothetical protein